MPLSDTVFDRLRASLGGWGATGRSGIDAAQTIARDAESEHRHAVTGLGVHLDYAAAKNPVTVNLLVAGLVAYGAMIPSGSTTPIVHDFRSAIGAIENATVALYVGPAGASVVTVANFSGFTV